MPKLDAYVHRTRPLLKPIAAVAFEMYLKVSQCGRRSSSRAARNAGALCSGNVPLPCQRMQPEDPAKRSSQRIRSIKLKVLLGINKA